MSQFFCIIKHAVADRPEGPYKYVETVLAPRPGYWDDTTCHNPHIEYVDGKYCLFYMGNSNGKTNTKRIGLATAPSLDGPWTRSDKPILEAGPAGAWDDHCTTNPAFIKRPNGEYWLYYKSWFSFYTKAEINDMEEEDKSELWLFGGHAIHGSICGLSASSAVYDFSLPSAYFGARLVLKSKDLALYMGKQFIDIWKDYVFIDGSNGNK